MKRLTLLMSMLCALSLSLSDLRAQCPDYDFVFGDPVLNGSQWQIDLFIANHTTSQVLFKGVGLTLAVWNSEIDQDLTENSSEIPNVPSDQFTWPDPDAFIVGYDPNGLEVALIPAAPSTSEPGLFRLLTIFFTGEPGECYHAEFTTPFPANQFFVNFAQGVSCYPLTYYLNPSEQPADSDDACYPALIIAGKILKTIGMLPCTDGVNFGVPDVDVYIDGISSATPQYVTSTGTNGSYMKEIENTYQGDDLRITPEKDNYPECGVTSLDLDMVKAYLIGYPNICWTYPWQAIAADVNKNGTISIADVLIIRKIVEDAPFTMDSWSFIPSDEYALLSTPYCNLLPPSFDPYRDLINFQSSKMYEDFVAVKMADVDGSCQDCDNNGMLHDPGQEEESLSREDNTIWLNCSVQALSDGTSELEFRTTQDVDLGILTLSFLAESGLVDWQGATGSSRFNDWSVNEIEGKVRLLYSDQAEYEKHVTAGEILLTIPLLPGQYATDLIQIGETWRNANTLNGQIEPIKINWSKSNRGFQLWPNPAGSLINLNSSQQGLYNLYNMQGSLMQRGNVQVGTNEIQLTGVLSGTYLIQVNELTERFIVK